MPRVSRKEARTIRRKLRTGRRTTRMDGTELTKVKMMLPVSTQVEYYRH
jgi:hypothetical protein